MRTFPEATSPTLFNGFLLRREGSLSWIIQVVITQALSVVTPTTANTTSDLIRVYVFCEYHWFYYISPKAFYESILVCILVAGSFRVSLFIDLGCPRDLGKGWRGDLGTFMISRPI